MVAKMCVYYIYYDPAGSTMRVRLDDQTADASKESNNLKEA